MAIFSIENEYGRQLQLSGMEHKWQIVSVTGLNQPNANLSLSVIPTFDGSRFNSSRLENRNVVITLAINGNTEENRMELNKVIFSKRFIKIKYKNNSVDVFVTGHVESFEYDVFDNKIMAQISIICEEPYWISSKDNETTLSRIEGLLEFPISLPEEGIAFSEILPKAINKVVNLGNVETGVKIILNAIGIVENPKIVNAATAQTMEIKTTMKAGDQLIVNTEKGNKSVVLYSENKKINLISALDLPVDWIRVLPGANLFSLTAQSGGLNLSAIICNSEKYGGV